MTETTETANALKRAAHASHLSRRFSALLNGIIESAPFQKLHTKAGVICVALP